MDYDDQKFKSNFLQKKQQEKKKAQDTALTAKLALKIQKNLRAFRVRNAIRNESQKANNLKLSLILKSDLSHYSQEEISTFISSQKPIKKQSISSRMYLKRICNAGLANDKVFPILINIIEDPDFRLISIQMFSDQKFIKVLVKSMESGNGSKLINLSIKYLPKSHIQKIPSKLLFDELISQFKEGYVQIQNPFTSPLSLVSIIYLLEYFSQINYMPKIEQNLAFPINKLLLYILNSYFAKNQSYTPQKMEKCLFYLLDLYVGYQIEEYNVILKGIIDRNKEKIALVQDQEDLEYCQKRLLQNQEITSFSNKFLPQIEKIMTHPSIVSLFEGSAPQSRIQKLILSIIHKLNQMFQDSKLIFIRSLLSSNKILKSMANSRNRTFYEGLNLKLIPMDDQQFQEFNLFSSEEWKSIITVAISKAFEMSKTIVLKENDLKKQKKVLIPFQPRNQQQIQLRVISEMLSNLYKKCLRTKKLPEAYFIDYNLSYAFQGFQFGMGAKAIQKMLKFLPFTFTFESRMIKLKEFIKNDKKNYDRTLFLQEQIDENLIITVRRGYQFLDAYQTCMNRDLRKKYKITFINEQGFEEEGIDGGGIIKQFINRVLKSSFSQVYGLFQETSLNEVIPNPYCPLTKQYEFIGKIVGKAVYEGINIQQKFAEPFLNLLIGRQNTFEDIQYIDPQIYKSLLQIKKMQSVEQLYQTFTILDTQPNGQKRYIDLLSPSKPSLKQTEVTNENKLNFILAYADFKCNKQIQEKTRLFRRGFLKVIKPQWLMMFNNQQLNLIISGGSPDWSVDELRLQTIYNDYHQKSQTIVYFWNTLKEFTKEEKALFLLYVTSCSRPPTLGFKAMKPKLCINRDADASHLPTANTCMNVMRLPDYKNKAILKKKLLYAISSKAGFEFA